MEAEYGLLLTWTKISAFLAGVYAAQMILRDLFQEYRERRLTRSSRDR